MQIIKSPTLIALQGIKQELLFKLLGQITPEQKDRFWRIYPDGVDIIHYEWAIQQLENTIADNAGLEVRYTNQYIRTTIKRP